MKIKGREIKGCNVETIIIPRGDGEDIIFKAKAIIDMEPFEKLCPEPTPPKLRTKDGIISDFKSKIYIDAVKEHSEKRHAWMILTSLSATEDLVWETVKLDDPNTWLGYRDELKAAGFSQVEVNRIIGGTFAANCLDESKLEEARNRFLASQLRQAAEQLSQTDEQENTQLGELVNASK